MHEPDEPIVSLVGFFCGVNVHEPLFDHVFTPGEFVEATADSFNIRPAVSDETFHVTIGAVAALTEGVTIDEMSSPNGTAHVSRRGNFIWRQS